MKLIFEYFIFCSGKFFKEHASINEMDCNFLLNGSYTEPTDYQKKKKKHTHIVSKRGKSFSEENHSIGFSGN